MKKFLFTLAALLMAGSALAGDYLYCDPIKITEEQVGTDVIVPVKAHFDNYVNAIQCDLTIPNGIQLRKIAKGADATITFLDMWGEETNTAETEGTIFVQKVATKNFAITQTDGGYWDANGDGEIDPDNESYGAVKWAPGDYAEMVNLTIRITATYTEGDITVVTKPACGQDTRPFVTPTDGVETTYTVTVQVGEDTPTPEDFTASGTITFAGNVATLNYTSNDDDAVVTVTVDGTAVNVTFVNGQAEVEIPVTDVPGTYSVPVVMTIAPGPDGSHVGDAVPVSENYEYTVAKPVFNGTAAISHNANVFTFTYTSNDPNATVVTNVDPLNWTLVDGVYTATYEAPMSTEVGEHTINVNMTVTPSDAYDGASVTAADAYNYTVNPEITPAAKPVITFTPNEAGVEVNIENYTEYTIKVDGVQVDPSRALPYQVNKGWEVKTIVVYAKNDPNPALYSATENVDTYNLAALENLPSDEAEAGTPTTNAESLIIPISGNVQSITVDGEPYALDANGNLVLPRQDVDWTPEIVIVTNDGEHHNDATVTINDITVPAILTIPAIDIVPGQAGGAVWHDPVQDPNTGVWTPGWTEYTVDGHYVDVTFSTNVENATLYWQILKEDGTVYLEGNTTDPTKTVTITEDGKYTAVAWIVTATDESKHNKKDFEINEMTSVNELVNGKTVANVRYFNVAGQEMQEANGMTIVVTTYTDGTTSTVKVMK